MKVKTIILFTSLLVFPMICISQSTDSLTIKKDTLWIGIENYGDIFSILYEIENKSSSTFYLWIEKDIHSSDREKIRDYIMRDKIKSEGSMSVYQMAMEYNSTYQCLSIYGSFLKKIKPKERFTIQIFSEEVVPECKKEQIFKYLDEHVVTVSEDTLRHYIVGVDNFNPQIFYDKGFITVPIKLFDCK